MKYKIKENYETWVALMQLAKRITDVNNKAAELADSVGATNYCRSQNGIGGGIAALEFKVKPEGYKKVGSSWDKLYYPKASNKELSQQIAELPIIRASELNEILVFKAPQMITSHGNLMMVSAPSVTWDDMQIIIDIPNGCKYDPPSDVIEILESEYQRIKEQIQAKK